MQKDPGFLQTRKFGGLEFPDVATLILKLVGVNLLNCPKSRLQIHHILKIRISKKCGLFYYSFVKEKEKFFSIVVSLRFPVFCDFPDKICSQYENPFLHNST